MHLADLIVNGGCSNTDMTYIQPHNTKENYASLNDVLNRKECWQAGDQPVTFFKDTNYTGLSVSLQFGSYPSLMTAGGSLKSMSSIHIGPFVEVTLYDGLNLSGSTLTLNGPTSIPNLGSYSFNDKAQSMTIVFVAPPIATQVACCRGSTTETCGNYIPGSPTCNDVLLSYCSKNMDSKCKTWLSANPQLADSIMPEWCRTHPKDPYCSCLLSPVLSNPKTKNINPKCVDSKCLLSGYLNYNMQTTACPSIITCEMQVALTNSGVQIGSYVPIQQNCGGNVTSATPTQNTSTTISNQTTAGQQSPGIITTTPITPPPSPWWATNEIYLIMFGIFLLFVFLIYLFVTLGDDSESVSVDGNKPQN